VVPGDVLVLVQGDNIPADCRLIEASGLRVNTATITGESRPSSRGANPTNVTEALDSANVLLAGTEIVAGEAKAVVFATGVLALKSRDSRHRLHADRPRVVRHGGSAACRLALHDPVRVVDAAG
jgi:hypothetical protein